MPNELINGACTFFNSAMHENRPVVFAGAGYGNKSQLLDYTLGNTWEESKHDFKLIETMYIYIDKLYKNNTVQFITKFLDCFFFSF